MPYPLEYNLGGHEAKTGTKPEPSFGRLSFASAPQGQKLLHKVNKHFSSSAAALPLPSEHHLKLNGGHAFSSLGNEAH